MLIGLKRRASTVHSNANVLLQSIREALNRLKWVPETSHVNKSHGSQNDLILITHRLVYKSTYTSTKCPACLVKGPFADRFKMNRKESNSANQDEISSYCERYIIEYGESRIESGKPNKLSSPGDISRMGTVSD